MPTLRINQHPGSAEDRYRIEVSAEDIPGIQPQSLSTEIAFPLTPQDREAIRWYLEDFLEFDQEPAPLIAERVEALMAERGEQLFREIFESSRTAMQLWAAVEPHLSSTRIEVTAGIAEAAAIPWELTRDPGTKTWLALSAQAFVRTQRGTRPTLAAQQPEAEKVRILLVICRPKGGEDVPFRSVAGRLVTRLSKDAREAFNLDVLRPPTFGQLATTLRLAKEQRRAYHVVHFDGHGVYADAAALANVGTVLSNLKLDASATGPRGFLVFEDPESETRSEFVDGFKLGTLLRDSGVPLLVLNACQSAFAEAAAGPDQAAPADAREEVQAYGSLAQAVVDAGAAGVVAMQYSVYAVTAAQFVAELYGALARGRPLGEAVTSARKNLADRPERRIAYEARPLQDWSVPVVWERAPLRLWPETPDAAPLRITMDEAEAAQPGALDAKLPARPDVGFYGRNETLYALDRAFDRHSIVLLHAYAGAGKTATAAEFLRWYALTGGVKGPVLFSSFEHHLPLARMLDKIGEVFNHALESEGVQWDAKTDSKERREIALQILKRAPVLWIWDNVEPVTGFPAGTESEWSADEQQELREFLTAARDTQAKFLLTSRRDEQAWLGELPRRVLVPPMPMQERLQLAGAIVERRGKRLTELPKLTPLLRITRGNPMTILVTVREALRAGIDTEERLDAYVDSLSTGEAAFENEETEGRDKSLGASLSYGFDHAFDNDECKILALLHLFQGFVNVDALGIMGHKDQDWCLEAVRGLTRERGIALLDRAAEVGLLIAHGGGYYTIHPALPWYFRDRFEHDYPAASGAADRARRAFVAAMAAIGDANARTYEEGNRDILSIAAAGEDNLLAAWRHGRMHGWWDPVTSAMQGLRALYKDTGRGAAWRRLVEAAVPDFVDTVTDGPLPGQERHWSLVTEYRVGLAREERKWPEAVGLQRKCIDWDRERAGPALEAEPDKRDSGQRNAIRTLAVSFHELGQIQREQDDPTCVDSYRESLRFAKAIGEITLQAGASYNLGHAYLDVAALRDLDEAERWCRQSLDLHAGDALGRGQCFNLLGAVAVARFEEAKAAGQPVEECARHLSKAARCYEQGLDLFPETAVTDLGVTHNQLGIIYAAAGYIDRGLQHFQQGIRYSEAAADTYGAGQTRHNVANLLFQAGRLGDARAYAEAAISDFRSFGNRAAAHIELTQQLIAEIDQAEAEAGGG